MSARSEILQKIRQLEKEKNAVLQEPDWVEEALVPVGNDLVQTFCSELEAAGGFSFMVDSLTDLIGALQNFLTENKLTHIVSPSSEIVEMLSKSVKLRNFNDFQTSDGIITFCELLVAQTGSVYMSSQLEGGRKTWSYPPIHMVIARANQVVPTIKEAISNTMDKFGGELPSQITMITGPSRTADIEKTLVKGAHGPLKLAVFILSENFH